MITLNTDSQLVGETQSTLWFSDYGPNLMQVTIKNSGVNTMNYRFQEWNGSAWTDLGTSGSDMFNTLSPNEVKQVTVSSVYPRVQMVGNASGGAFLEFAVMRYSNRPSGGSIPILQ